MTEYVLMPGADYQNICNALREKTGSTELIRSGEIAGQIADLSGNPYDVFWDVYQDKGNRTQYAHAFRGSGWTDATFKPKYDIVCNEWDNYLFSGSRIVDIKGILESQGVTLDTSKVSGLTYFFQNCSATVRIPALDMRSCTSFLGAFYGCMALQEIEMNHVREDLTGNNAFVNCTALTAVKITGTIGTSAFNFKHSPLLTNESVQSIIGCLKDLTGETTQTVTFHADVGAKMTEEQKATITAKNWTLVY